jgi:NADH-quinone oxidoreductase E subunit
MSAEFEFTPENKKIFERILTRYPNRRAAMLPAIHLALKQHGLVSPEVEAYISELLEVPLVDVREVVSFYSLFHQRAHGKHHLCVCTSLSCWIRGSDEIRAYLREKLGIDEGEVTEDGEYSWEAVPDCLGACELAPMLAFDGYFQGNLTEEKIDELLDGNKSKS